MGDNSAISWTDSTWNPFMGCRKVSAGCKFCYMYRDMAKYGRDPLTVVRSKTKFDEPLKWADPRKVFTCSWSDWFIEEADPWRDEAWDIIRRTPQHTYQILTKRPERILDHLPCDWGEGWPNVWLGVSVEDQAAADKRIPLLLAVPTRVRFLSCEPLLGALVLRTRDDFSDYGHGPRRLGMSNNAAQSAGIHWVIVGGESGPTRREMDMAWARSIRDQCVSAGVPLWFKQQSALKPGHNPFIVEEDGTRTVWHQFPESVVRS